MGLFYKEVSRINRSMYLYYPDHERHNPYMDRLLTILRPDAREASVQALLDDGLKEIADSMGRTVLAIECRLAKMRLQNESSETTT